MFNKDLKHSTINGTQTSTLENAERRYGTYIGFVTEAIDVQRMGRLRVWIPELGATRDDVDNHVIASYGSPFAGSTSFSGVSSRPGEEKLSDKTQTSYGMWFIPPDVGVQVLVTFINGDSSRAVWFACLYDQNMNQMVPANGADVNYQYSCPTPVNEYNKYDDGYDISKKNIRRPWTQRHAEALAKQGLSNDAVRGPTESSARREDTSQVFGIITPGPEIEGQTGRRTGGHQFVMDDRIDSEYIRFRTRNGTQIKLDDTNGLIYIINKDGSGWIQIDADGNIDIFGKGSLSMRAANGDINLKAGGNVNIEAGKNLNIKTISGSHNMEINGNQFVKVSGNGMLTVGGSYDLKVGSSTKIQTGTYDLKSGQTNIDGSTVNVKASGGANIDAGSTLNLKGGSQTNVGAGSKVSLQSGTIAMDGGIAINVGASSSAGGAGGASTAGSAPNVTTLSKSDVSQSSGVPCAAPSKSNVNTIVSRLPTFEPCPEHKATRPIDLNMKTTTPKRV